MPRPNILLVTTDTQRTDSIGAYGSPHAASPQLDQLARDGVLWEQCHSPHPVCCPARCCLITGQYALTGGALENGVERRTGVPTMPESLREAGYHTIMVGKTHFGERPDFDELHELRGEKNQDRDDFYADHVRALGFSRASRHPNPIPAAEFVDAYCVTRTIDCLERAPADRPWFAFCSLLSPHGPLDPPRPWDEHFAGIPLPDDDEPRCRLADEAGPIRDLLGYDGERSGGQGDRRSRELYYGLCSYVDEQIGRLLTWLDDRGLAEDTLVIVTSDHGISHFADGYSNKHVFRPGSWRVPLLMRWPGRLPAGRRLGFASWADLCPTILAAADCPRPWPQGFNLLTPLLSGTEEPRYCCVGSLLDSLALVTRRWTYEWHPESDEERLFDRGADPCELHDLGRSPAHATIRQQALRALAGWRAQLHDQADLQARLSGGGPVAERVVTRLGARRGDHAEARLQARAAALDALEPPSHAGQAPAESR